MNRKEFEHAIVEIRKYAFYSQTYGNSVPLGYIETILGQMLTIEPIFPQQQDEITESLKTLIRWMEAEVEAESVRCTANTATRKLINLLMDERDCSLRKLAEMLGCSASYLSKVERGVEQISTAMAARLIRFSIESAIMPGGSD